MMFKELLCLIAMIIVAVVAEEMHITFVNNNPAEVSFSTFPRISFPPYLYHLKYIIIYIILRQLNSSGKIRKTDDVCLKERYHRVVDQLQ